MKTKDLVRHLLKQSPEARDSINALLLEFCNFYGMDVPKKLKKFIKNMPIHTIERCMRKIQNEEKLYPASPNVKHARKLCEEYFKKTYSNNINDYLKY
jgi:hypothetical protein